MTASTRQTQARPARAIRLGLHENLAQFSLLVGVNALVGGMIGQERTVLPLLAEREFGLTAFTAALTFIAAFGAVKAATNFFAGTLSDRYGRKPVLIAGWLIGLPVPLLLIWAPAWGWVIAANVLLGINQGLTWSTTVIMKIDLVGPERRGFAMGLNEAAGYGAVAITALATGFIAEHAGLRPEPFYLGLVFAGLGLGLSVLFVRETRDHARHEATHHIARHDDDNTVLRTGEVFTLTSFREKALSSCSQAGLVNNLNDGLAWGLFPIAFADAGLSVGRIGILAALYPAVWGFGQLITGGLSDRIGRKPLIAGGMLTQAVAIGWIAATTGFWAWALGAVILGAGTAMVYPTLLAAIGDVAHPSWRARSVGVYRLWRDGGFAVGALVAGILADVVSIDAAIWAVAALTAASGILVVVRMYETHPPPDRHGTPTSQPRIETRSHVRGRKSPMSTDDQTPASPSTTHFPPNQESSSEPASAAATPLSPPSASRPSDSSKRTPPPTRCSTRSALSSPAPSPQLPGSCSPRSESRTALCDGPTYPSCWPSPTAASDDARSSFRSVFVPASTRQWLRMRICRPDLACRCGQWIGVV